MRFDTEDTLTQEQFAELIGVTQPSVSRLQGIGVLPAALTLGPALLAYCGRLREMAAGRASSAPDALDLAAERAALARTQREGLEIKNAALRREFAPVALLADVLATASQAVAERFDHLPGVLKRACPQLDDAGRAQVLAVVAEARNEWRRATAELIAPRVAAWDDGEDELVDE